MFYPLLALDCLEEGLMNAKTAGGENLLLIHHLSKTYIIENKCGHFGLPLHTGSLIDGTIVCRQHGISFYLTTGEISNRPYENCGSVKVFPVVFKDGFIGVELN